MLGARVAGLRFTRNRRIILSVFLAVTEPVTVNELWLRAKQVDSRTSFRAAWRLLSELAKCGLAHREISPADGILRYLPPRPTG
jgi:Fe2+ or Zn2+ uptake regulation protein